MCLAAEAARDGILDKSTFNTDDAKAYVKLFNELCRSSFVYTICKFNDYSQSIISKSDFQKYLDLSKQVFEPQWKFLSALRKIDKASDSMEMVHYNKRQVYSTILALQCITNSRKRPYWGLINTAAQYGQGVCVCVVNYTTFWGTAVSRTYRGQKLSEFTENLVKKQRVTLLADEACLAVWDNFNKRMKKFASFSRLQEFINTTEGAVARRGQYRIECLAMMDKRMGGQGNESSSGGAGAGLPDDFKKVMIFCSRVVIQFVEMKHLNGPRSLICTDGLLQDVGDKRV